MLLLERIIRLVLSVRPDPVLFAFIEAVVAGALRHALLRLLTLLVLVVVGILLPELLLRRGDQPEVVLGMLVVILSRDRIAGAL